jgi:hypothetical protein
MQTKLASVLPKSKAANLFAAAHGVTPALLSKDVTDMRASKSGTISVGRENRLEAESAAADAAQMNQTRMEAEAAQRKSDAEKVAQEEEMRKRLAAAQTGGYASTILGGRTPGLGSGAAGRMLYGS